MSTGKTDWTHVLPVSRVEMWIIRAFTVMAIFAAGVGAGTFYTRDRFEAGQDHMLKTITFLQNNKAGH